MTPYSAHLPSVKRMQAAGDARHRPARLLLFVLLVLLQGSFPEAACGLEHVSIAQDGVRIRAAPGLETEVYWLAFKDYPLQVLDQQGDWLRIKDFANDSGWVYAPLTKQERTFIVRVQQANLRAGPGINYEIVAQAVYGVVFQFLEVEAGVGGNWLHVRHQDGTRGWIHEKLLWPPGLFRNGP